MKIWSKATIVAIAILGAALMGCGSDSKSSSSSTTDTGAVATTDDGTPATGDTTTPPEEDTAAPGCVPPATPPTGACTNTADDAIFQDPNAKVSDHTSTCGVGCIGKKDAIACSQPCIQEATKLSCDCSFCLASQVACAIDKCIGECAAAPAGKACCDCRVTNNCVADFDKCSGQTSSACPTE